MLHQVRRHRKQYRDRRADVLLPVISLVGYTNAGTVRQPDRDTCCLRCASTFNMPHYPKAPALCRKGSLSNLSLLDFIITRVYLISGSLCHCCVYN